MCVRDGFVQTTGTVITNVLLMVTRFSPTGERTKKRDSVIEKLKAFFNKFWDISGGKFLKISNIDSVYVLFIIQVFPHL